MRTDTGIEAGSVIGGQFDSLLAKIIVTGSSRTEAIERSRRALDELIVEGMATALPFHQAVVRDPAFAPEDPKAAFTVHNRWIETEFDNQIPPFSGAADAAEEDGERERVVVEVGGKRLEVVLPAGFGAGSGSAARPRRRSPATSAPGTARCCVR